MSVCVRVSHRTRDSVLVLLVDRAHQGCCWRQHLIYKNEDSLLWGQLDPLSDDIDELTDGEILAEVKSAGIQEATHKRAAILGMKYAHRRH